MSENNYLFRGKALWNNKFMFGYYIYLKDTEEHHIVDGDVFGEGTRVDPETVGQWSGLHGTSFPARCKIFTGDRVLTREPTRDIESKKVGSGKLTRFDPPYIKEIESTVVFHMGAFRLRRQDGDQVHMVPLDFYFDEPYRDRLKDAFLVREHEKWSDILQGLLEKYSLDDQDALIEHMEEVVVIGNVHEKN